MKATQNMARISGLIYLGVVLTGLFSLMYVPSKLIDWKNPALTFTNIQSNQLLFRFGILGSVLCYLFFLFLPLSIYKLLNPVHKTAAQLMVLLAVVSVPIALVNLQNEIDIISLINKSIYLESLSFESLETQVLFQLDQYNSGILVVQLFWGLWLLPFGWLVFTSKFLPKLLGILLMIGCFSYLINFLGTLLIANYSSLGIAGFIQLPASISEIGTCLWLLIMGTKKINPSTLNTHNGNAIS
jgi:Domain of unknown function (DUF4386)